MRKGRTANCIFCDDVRQEVGGKFSLMGIYTGDMLIGTDRFPTVLPKLAIHVLVSTPVSEVFSSLKAFVIGTTGEELASLEAEASSLPPIPEVAEDIKKFTLGLTAILSSINIAKEGNLEVWVELDDERERAGQLRVKLNSLVSVTAPTASSPPSAPPPLAAPAS